MQSLRRARGIATRIWRGRGTGVVGVWVLPEWGFLFSRENGYDRVGWLCDIPEGLHGVCMIG